MKRRITGPRAVLEALRRDARALSVILLEEPPSRGGREIRAAAERARVPVERRSRAELDALTGEVRHQGVVAIAGDYPYASFAELLDEAPALIVALDEITDPHNLGAIVRSAVALGAGAVVLPRHRAARVTPTVVRVSAGATEHARIAPVKNLALALDACGERGMEVIGLDGEASERLRDLGPSPGGRVVVIGSEGRGLRPGVRKRCHRLCRIELAGPIASLNASVAAGIAIYEATRVQASRDGQQEA